MLPGITKEEFVDVVCHKTSHVVQTTRLVGLARSAEVRVRLESIGHGGAVVRLPAKFDAERAAAAIQAVVRKGASASAKGNVAVDTDPVDEMYAAVTDCWRTSKKLWRQAANTSDWLPNGTRLVPRRGTWTAMVSSALSPRLRVVPPKSLTRRTLRSDRS